MLAGDGQHPSSGESLLDVDSISALTDEESRTLPETWARLAKGCTEEAEKARSAWALARAQAHVVAAGGSDDPSEIENAVVRARYSE